MEVITRDSSNKNEKELLNDAETQKKAEKSKIGGDDQKETSFEFWLREFLLSAIMFLTLNPLTVWFWAPFMYFLS